MKRLGWAPIAPIVRVIDANTLEIICPFCSEQHAQQVEGHLGLHGFIMRFASCNHPRARARDTRKRWGARKILTVKIPL